MSNLNQIGLDNKAAENISHKLNLLLANYQIFYMNTRGFHWNIKGNQFFELHIKFEELYNDLFLKIDEIAERIQTLGFTPLHSYSQYLENAKLEEKTHETDGNTIVKEILDTFQTLLVDQRDILEIASEAKDEGTVDLITGYISGQEKLVWMYRAYLN